MRTYGRRNFPKTYQYAREEDGWGERWKGVSIHFLLASPPPPPPPRVLAWKSRSGAGNGKITADPFNCALQSAKSRQGVRVRVFTCQVSTPWSFLGIITRCTTLRGGDPRRNRDAVPASSAQASEAVPIPLLGEAAAAAAAPIPLVVPLSALRKALLAAVAARTRDTPSRRESTLRATRWMKRIKNIA